MQNHVEITSTCHFSIRNVASLAKSRVGHVPTYPSGPKAPSEGEPLQKNSTFSFLRAPKAPIEGETLQKNNIFSTYFLIELIMLYLNSLLLKKVKIVQIILYVFILKSLIKTISRCYFYY